MKNKLYPVLIVLYNPDENCLLRIKNISSDVEIFIYDNSTEILNHSIQKITNYHHSNKNNGITGGLLWMKELCRVKSITSFIFFDQDTIFNINTIEHITSVCSNEKDLNKISHFTSENKKTGEVEYIINSGTVFKIDLLEKLTKNVLNRYFVDAVDLAICLFGSKIGYKIYTIKTEGIDHHTEQGKITVTLFKNKFELKVYSNVRAIEFYKSHFRLLIDSLKIIKIRSAITILKFIISFTIEFNINKFLLKFGKNEK